MWKKTNWGRIGLIFVFSILGFSVFCEQENVVQDVILDDAALRSAVLDVLENEYGIFEIELLSEEMWERIATLDDFIAWRTSLVEQINSGSQLAETNLGTVEYQIQGSGPIIFALTWRFYGS
jgi:hypothetical protein